MDIKRLKQYIFNNNKVDYILSQIGCKNIVRHNDYYTCANYDGDNTKAICQYFNSEYLNCINYTRDIKYNKTNNHSTSIIDLVCYNKKINIFQCVKYLCDILGLDYYEMENEDDIPESLKMLQMLYDMKSGEYIEENYKLQPISEKILKYYKPYVNDMFANDNISYEIQKYFEIGYDDETNYITIPIRDELDNLVGVKGRYFGNNNEVENKYIALERYAKSKILYGLNKSIRHIKNSGKCYILEAEKSVMKLFGYGYLNCVSIGGHQISRTQLNKLVGMCIDIIICFDKDVEKNIILNECKKIKEKGVNKVFYLLDKDNILEEKEAPCDDPKRWEILLHNNIYEYKEN